MAKAARISSGHATLPAADGDAAIVLGDAAVVPEFVVQPGQPAAACTCEAFLHGQVCEHVVKVRPDTVSLDLPLV